MADAHDTGADPGDTPGAVDTFGAAGTERSEHEPPGAPPVEEPGEDYGEAGSGPQDEEAGVLAADPYPESHRDEDVYAHREEEAEGRCAEEAAVRVASAEDAEEDPYGG